MVAIPFLLYWQPLFGVSDILFVYQCDPGNQPEQPHVLS